MARTSKKAQHQQERMAQLKRAFQVVKTGVCPTCGTKLYRNSALAGWFQCGRFGAVGFQKEAGPHCDFQIFYDPTPEQHAIIIMESK